MSHWIDALNHFSAAWAPVMFRACWQGGIGLALVLVFAVLLRKLPAHLTCWMFRLAYLKPLLVLVWLTPITLAILAPPPPGSLASAQALPAVEPVATPADFPIPESDAPLPVVTSLPHVTHLSMASLLCILWIVGVLVMTARLLAAYLATRRLRKSAIPVSSLMLPDLSALLALRKLPELRAHPQITAPLLVGIWRPAILLPESHNYLPAQLRLILAHELAHICRRDLAWNLLQALVSALFFFHPLVWFANARWRLAQELACDQLTLQSTRAHPADYAHTLLHVIQHRIQPRRPVIAVAVAESHRSLKWRLHAMLTLTPWSKKRTALVAVTLAVAAALALVPFQLTARAADPMLKPTPPAARAVDRNASTSGGVFTGNVTISDTAPAVIVSGSIQAADSFTGTLTAPTLEIRSPRDGVIAAVLVKDGQAVKERDALVEFQRDDIAAEYEAIVQELRQAQATLKRDTEGGVASAAETDSARLALLRAEAALQAKQRELEQSIVRAPFAGTLRTVDLVKGQAVVKNEPLTTLVNTDSIRAEIPVPSGFLPKLKVGQKVTVQCTVFEGKTFEGEITYIAPNIDPGSNRLLIRAAIKNTDGILKPGMEVTLTPQ